MGPPWGRTREILFVGRWGDLGPELYLVAKRVRRMDDPYRRNPLGFARRILAEVMWCEPGTRLARAFASAQLDPLPCDGFVMSASDVEAWLDGYSAAPGRF
jgi:hypothetical protein